jgi:hypothetical protein
MLILKLDIEGLRDSLGRFTRFESVLLGNNRRALTLFRSQMLATLRSKAPVGKTGKFRDSFYAKTRETASSLEIGFASRDPRAAYIIYPTKPHTITAVRKKKLRFWVGESKVFAKSVKHPGTEGSDFVEEAFDEGSGDFIRRIEEAGSRTMVYLSGKGG